MGKWEMVRLGDVGESFIGLTYKPENIVDDGIIVLRSGNVQNNAIDLTDIIRVDKVPKNRLLVRDGDILMCSRNGSANLVGKSTMISNLSENMTFGAFMMIYRSKSNPYITHFFHSPYFKRQLTKSATTTINQITKSMLDEVVIPLPPIDEQKRIAKNLDLASEIVKGYKEQLAELDKLVQSVFYEMFGNPVTNEKGWDSAPLSKTARIVTGNTPPRNCKENYGCHIEWIKTDNITDSLYVTQASEYLSARGASIGRLVDADAILMACIAGSIKSIGRVAIANRVVAFNQQINAVIANKYDTLFLYWLFKMTREYIQSTINMSLKGILSKGKLEKLVFIVPPISLQTRFASIVTEIETQKAQVQQALAEAQNLFNSLMQEYFE